MQLAVGVTNPTTRPIAIDLGLTSQDPAWSFKPEHLHAKIEAGATKSFPFQVQRTAGGFGKSFRGPQLTLAVDYLDAKVRVTLPRREVPVPVTLATTPEGHFEGASPGALRLQHNSCVRVASSAIRLPDGPLTLEGWMRARDLSGRRAFLSKTENSEYGIFVRDGRPDFSVHLNGKYVSAAGYKGQLKVGRWHHLAGVYDGKQVRLYLDGKLIAKADGSGRRTLNHLPLYIGADPGQSGQAMSWFDGLIDEVRLSKVARYTANFTPPQRHDTDGETLLLHHLDRALGPFTLDHSTHQAHGLKTGTAAIRRLEKDTFRSK